MKKSKEPFYREVTRSDGSKYTDNSSLYIRYYHPGKGYTVTECCHTTEWKKAEKMLQQRERMKENSEPIPSSRVKMSAGLAMVETDYKNNDYRSLDKVERINRLYLQDRFGLRKANSISASEIEAYKAELRDKKFSKAHVNRILSVLRRGFRLLHGASKIPSVPLFKMLDEKDNVREGFLELEQIIKLLGQCHGRYTFLHPVLEFAYTYGWRKQEIVSLLWEQINRVDCVITLNVRQSKNKRIRHLYYGKNEEIRSLIEKQWQSKIEIEHGSRRAKITHVFFHADGRPIRDFRGSWESICEKAKVKALFHDLRRSAVRNMIRIGLSEKVAMAISGHMTRSVFDRYNITSQRDLEEGAGKLGIDSQIRVQFEYKAKNEQSVNPSDSDTSDMFSTVKTPQ